MLQSALIASAAIAITLSSAAYAGSKPVDCQPSKEVWWFNHTLAAIRSDGERGLNPTYSNFEAGVADITWMSGKRQVVRLGQVGDQWCIVLSRDVPVSTDQASLE